MFAMWSHPYGYIFLIFDVPQNGFVSESLTHTSGHRLVKSTPRELSPVVSLVPDLSANHVPRVGGHGPFFRFKGVK